MFGVVNSRVVSKPVHRHRAHRSAIYQAAESQCRTDQALLGGRVDLSAGRLRIRLESSEEI